MSLRALRTLVVIARKGSFAAAADQLGLTQAAVSLQIKNLEDQLETELFNREGRRPRLNASGRLVVERAGQILERFDGLKEELNPERAIGGELRLGAVQSVVTGPLPPVLARLQQAHPALRIRLFCSLSAELALRVEEDDLDGALITEPIRNIPASCQWLEYDSESFYLVAPQDSPPRSAQEFFANYPFIRFDRTAWAGTMVDNYLLQHKIQPRDVMEFDSCEAALSLVAQGLGITVVPFGEKRLEEARAHFSLHPFGNPPLTRGVGLYRKRRHPRARLLELVLEEVRQEVST